MQVWGIGEEKPEEAGTAETGMVWPRRNGGKAWSSDCWPLIPAKQCCFLSEVPFYSHWSRGHCVPAKLLPLQMEKPGSQALCPRYVCQVSSAAEGPWLGLGRPTWAQHSIVFRNIPVESSQHPVWPTEQGWSPFNGWGH